MWVNFVSKTNVFFTCFLLICFILLCSMLEVASIVYKSSNGDVEISGRFIVNSLASGLEVGVGVGAHHL